MTVVWTSTITFPTKPGCTVLGSLVLFLTGDQVGVGEDAFISSLELHDEVILNLAASLENNLDSEKKTNVNFLGFNSQAEEGDQSHCFQLTQNVPCNPK